MRKFNLGVTSFSEIDKVERYKNITIIPPKKISAITKNSHEEFIMPDRTATWSLIKTKRIEIETGLLAFIIIRKVMILLKKIILNKFLFP